jgi:hypothetical protein
MDQSRRGHAGSESASPRWPVHRAGPGAHERFVEPVTHDVDLVAERRRHLRHRSHIDGWPWPAGGRHHHLRLVQIYSLEYVRGGPPLHPLLRRALTVHGGHARPGHRREHPAAALGWEIMGLCSFMLIGHWWEDKKNSDAALKAFFTTRTGDIGLLDRHRHHVLGAGSFSIDKINAWALSGD